MPYNQSVKQSLVLIENDSSKILGLVVGEHKPQPGPFIPKRGKSAYNINREQESGNLTLV
jgi:hypothetical protein